MDGYEADIARQPGGPFTKVHERKTIRRIAEQWVDRQRYSEERARRFATYAKWLGIGVPAVLAVWKLAEAFLGK